MGLVLRLDGAGLEDLREDPALLGRARGRFRQPPVELGIVFPVREFLQQGRNLRERRRFCAGRDSGGYRQDRLRRQSLRAGFFRRGARALPFLSEECFRLIGPRHDGNESGRDQRERHDQRVPQGNLPAALRASYAFRCVYAIDRMVSSTPCLRAFSSIQPTMWSPSTWPPASRSRSIEALHVPTGSVRRVCANSIASFRGACLSRVAISTFAASARCIALVPPGAAMISRTLARKRTVAEASVQRKTIFSHISSSMSGESFQSTWLFASASARALERVDVLLSSSPKTMRPSLSMCAMPFSIGTTAQVPSITGAIASIAESRS